MKIKTLFVICITLMLILVLPACNKNETPDESSVMPTQNESLTQSQSTHMPDNTKAPSLSVILTSGRNPMQSIPLQSFKAIQLATSWYYTDENGVGRGYEQDSPHALQLSNYRGYTLRYDHEDDHVYIQFQEYNIPQPQSVTVQRWNAAYYTGTQDIADALYKSESVEVEETLICVKDDGNDYIYEVYATWTEGLSTGSSRYAFRVDSAEHHVTIPIVPYTAPQPKVETIAAGSYFSLVILDDGSLWSWGSNFYGNLGDGKSTTRSYPVKIMDEVVSVSAGDTHAAAIKRDGSLWIWGHSIDGRLGDGITADRSNPVKVMENIASVDVGGEHTLALTTDGEVWSWGYNYYGQIGDGTYTHREVESGLWVIKENNDRPLPVKVLDDIVMIAAGETFSLAIATDGGLWVWGQLGFGDFTETYHVPEKIMDDVVYISAGSYRAMAITSDGSLQAYGLKDDALPSFGKFSSVAEIFWRWEYGENGRRTRSCNYTLALATDGVLWAWGENFEQEPVKLMEDVVSFSANRNHALITTDDGDVWAIGAHLYQGYDSDYDRWKPFTRTMKIVENGVFRAVPDAAIYDFLESIHGSWIDQAHYYSPVIDAYVVYPVTFNVGYEGAEEYGYENWRTYPLTMTPLEDGWVELTYDTSRLLIDEYADRDMSNWHDDAVKEEYSRRRILVDTNQQPIRQLTYMIDDTPHMLVKVEPERDPGRYQVEQIENGLRLTWLLSDYMPFYGDGLNYEDALIRIYRSTEKADKGMLISETRLGHYWPSEKNPALYEYTDTAVEAGQTYYYSIWSAFPIWHTDETREHTEPQLIGSEWQMEVSVP